MGLDIYLYTRAHAEQDDRHYAEWDALWARKEAGELTDEQWEVERKKITPEVSLAEREGKSNSKTNPEHLFNRRYLRSSYNSSGFNSVCSNFGGHSLYWMFEPLDVDFDESEFWLRTEDVEKLKECRDRALQVAQEIVAWDRLMVAEFDAPLLGDADHLWKELPTEEQALEWGREELAKPRMEGFGDGGYSTAKGAVFPAGFDLLAITLGRPKYNFRVVPVTSYGIYRVDEDTVKFYEDAALITAEFCEEAISLIDQDGSVKMVWSG